MEEEHKVLRLVEVVVPQVEHGPAVMDQGVDRGLLPLPDKDDRLVLLTKKSRWHHQENLILWD